jgi:glutamate 5-kinase
MAETAPGEMMRAARRIVVKVGSSLLAKRGVGLDRAYVGRLADAIAQAKADGRVLALVTSGAIAAGLERMGIRERPKSLRHLQAAAAVGQIELAHAYTEEFGRHGFTVGQVLITRDGIENRERYLNARNTLLTLLADGIIPIINENDTVSVDEIRFGDNDTLAALTAALVDADLLVIFTDVAGFCAGDPSREGGAEVIAEVDEVTPELESMALGPGSSFGSGGMRTKLAAARTATARGSAMVLASGRDPGALSRILSGESVGTFFRPRSHPLEARKAWIAYASARTGTVVVNDGAKAAILDRKTSLLAVGIKSVRGAFRRGDTIGIADESGREFARGVTCYSADEVERIKGMKSDDLPAALGADYAEPEVVNRDDLAVL